MGDEAGRDDPQKTVTIGVPRETRVGERRVALVPKVLGKLSARGATVVVEAGAGAGALIPDEEYTAAGAEIGDPWAADVVAVVNAPSEEQIGRLRSGQVLIGFLSPLTDPQIVQKLRGAGVTGFAMESIPRISRAQGM